MKAPYNQPCDLLMKLQIQNLHRELCITVSSDLGAFNPGIKDLILIVKSDHFRRSKRENL